MATEWLIQDESGAFHNLHPVGCREGKFCVLVSSYIWMTSPLSLDDDYITNDVRLLDEAYIYGCSLVGERVKPGHYKLHFVCMLTQGIFHSPSAIGALVGGDVLVSAPAMPGFSGAPLLTYRDGRLMVVGTVNSGVEGVFTAANFVAPEAIGVTQEWLKLGEGLYNHQN